MAVHHPNLLDLPPSTVVAMEPPHQQQLSFDHGQLLALHVDATDGMSSSIAAARGGGGVLAADDTTSGWPQAAAAVSLSLHNLDDTTPSLFGHHHHQQQFSVPSLQVPNNHQQQLMPASSMMRSKYLGPAQELLTEFCSLLEGDLHAMNNKHRAPPKAGRWDDVETSSSSSGLWGHPSLMSSMDLLELERRKTRLLSMVEEVDRRYRRYREQMRSVEASFEAVAGVGAAQVYTRLALQAMSRHFRCLRDALVAQLRKLRNKSMATVGDTTAMAAAGATKGDTPRLKVLDQCLRQQRAFQQPGTIENYPWRPQRGLPERAVAVLRAWLFEHFLHPYPNDVDKHILARQTGLSRSQVSNWFINARVRLWKPMIEDMYTEEVKQQSDQASHGQNPTGVGAGAVKAEQHNTAAMGGQSHFRTNLGNHTTTSSMNNISSSIIGGGEHHLQFSSRSAYPPSMMHGGAVSLTLGLHHHRSFMLQGQEEQPVVLPYRDLAGSHLLHDLTG